MTLWRGQRNIREQWCPYLFMANDSRSLCCSECERPYTIVTPEVDNWIHLLQPWMFSFHPLPHTYSIGTCLHPSPLSFSGILLPFKPFFWSSGDQIFLWSASFLQLLRVLSWIIFSFSSMTIAIILKFPHTHNRFLIISLSHSFSSCPFHLRYPFVKKSVGGGADSQQSFECCRQGRIPETQYECTSEAILSPRAYAIFETWGWYHQAENVKKKSGRGWNDTEEERESSSCVRISV